ncbi:hypothetical protein Taro_056767 [Colocasia esculenta]|uniref:Uncharacterized protein n=1 Tax=Colocasia esculenta TaxID=4460 RepID=A0A843XUU3_COLES|nr:hypothetical protein [Colocasia esculenta]
MRVGDAINPGCCCRHRSPPRPLIKEQAAVFSGSPSEELGNGEEWWRVVIGGAVQEMATNPGLFTAWPWQTLGNFKFLLLAPFVARSVYRFVNGEVDLGHLTVIPVFLVRVVHALFWISWSRFQTARSKHRIVNKSLDFEQVDRERNWDDQILLTALLLYLANIFSKGATNVPWWNTRGVVLTILLHAGPVEFIYYWLHRALHHHYLYSRYHSHHHASIVTEPITGKRSPPHPCPSLCPFPSDLLKKITIGQSRPR